MIDGLNPDLLYRGRLAELWPILKREVERAQQPGQWAWRHLPNGALVALTYEPELHQPGKPVEKRLVLRISRMQKPATPKGEAMWERELQTFVKHFGVEQWERLTDLENYPHTLGISAVFRGPVE